MDAIIVALATISLVLIYETLRLRKQAKDLIQTKVLNQQLNLNNRDLQAGLIEIQEELGLEREKNRTLLSQKKSSETRLGQISEHLVPFLQNCRHEPKDMHFLGNPIDYVIFNMDEGSITFLEVKSGNSKPSKRQKVVKNIIKSGRVYYEEIRINEKGVRSKLVNPLEEDLENDKRTRALQEKSKEVYKESFEVETKKSGKT